MAPEERADEALSRWEKADIEPGISLTASARAIVTSAIRAAVAEEREACAAMAEEMDRPGGVGPGHCSDGFEIAAAIRARGQ